MEEICRICGSREIVLLDKTTKKYRCNSCDEVFELTNNPIRIIKTTRRDADSGVLTVKEIYKKNIDSIYEINCSFGDELFFGTCFLISKTGYFLTNAHVVITVDKYGKAKLCDSVYFCKSRSADYKELEIVYIDPKNDLVLLKAKNITAKPITFSKTDIEIGDRICAVGNSKGVGLSLVDGIVSDINREVGGHNAFLFSAIVTNGCSGGPIFNDKGEVCGVTFGGQADAPSMNYGLPLTIIKEFITKAEKEKGISRII